MKAEYIRHTGDDLAVVNAAKVSFDKESEWEFKRVYMEDEDTCYPGIDLPVLSEKDQKLIQFLARGLNTEDFEKFVTSVADAGEALNKWGWNSDKDHLIDLLRKWRSQASHWSPFSGTSNHIILRMQAPVPIRTQCFKHKVGFNENEESRRYITSTPQLFIPEFFRAKPEGSIKQGSGEEHPRSGKWLQEYFLSNKYQIKLYEDMVADGVCPEQARFVLPQGVEVNWIWGGSLAAYARFYNQRTDPHAQKEVQDLAKAVGTIIEPLFPVSWKALTNG